MTKKLGIIDLLSLYGFDPQSSAKLVRHQDSRYDVRELLRNGWLEAYQGYQSKRIFHDLDHLIVFLGEARSEARFFGVYRILGVDDASEVFLPPGCPYSEWPTTSEHFYRMERVPGFEELEGRVVIDWGKGALAWHQKLRNKEVVEVRRGGELRPPFEDYVEFELTHDELVELFDRAEANKEWRARLSAVAGIYLILASTTGDQYVGSAHGARGIWGRWEAYAKNGHGGNKELRRLVDENPAYPRAFRYSVLQVLPKTRTKADVLEWESRYKQKLGSRARGLNLN